MESSCVVTLVTYTDSVWMLSQLNVVCEESV